MNVLPLALGAAAVVFWVYQRGQGPGPAGILPPPPAAPLAPDVPPPATVENPTPRPGEVWRITGTISPSPPEGFRDQMIASYKRSQAAAGNRVVRGPEFLNGGFVVDMEAGANPSPIFIGRSVEIGPYTIAITSAAKMERS